ncbi:MAG: response regulator [Pseudomonadota bacterium]|uniref:Response regulator n=1 Tax=Candidatus Desulfatibia profunda TaxID=2841695 RepID=A0A8J6TKT9_9BACT|nr:response regulator [Candidatus Desulfatibia profunda]MBL7178890.1 response regulator [Desulfobacterales bacterium]
MKTILHLDDSIIALKLVEKALSGFARLISVTTIADALTAMAKHDIDCFLIDNVLADGNGLDFAKAIRSKEKHHNTPILLITAGLSENVAYHSMKAGINQCVSKPVQPATIKHIIAQQIAKPIIQKIERTRIDACGVRWESLNQVFEYSLDTGQLVQGYNSEETREKMRTVLKAKIADDIKNFEGVTNVQIVNYLLEIMGGPPDDL